MHVCICSCAGECDDAAKVSTLQPCTNPKAQLQTTKEKEGKGYKNIL